MREHLKVQQVSTERQGFFSKPRQQHPQLKDTGGGFAVGDDAMAAMAMAAMTQELTVMKHSLQKEVRLLSFVRRLPVFRLPSSSHHCRLGRSIVRGL